MRSARGGLARVCWPCSAAVRHRAVDSAKPWLRTKILGSIIEQAEKASGGRVEIGSFDLDWRTLTAQLNRFVVRGTEPAGQAPLLSVDSLRVRVRIISLLRRDISIRRLRQTRRGFM